MFQGNEENFPPDVMEVSERSEVVDIEDMMGSKPNAASTSTVTVSKKRAREETTKHDLMTSWREQLGPVPSMGQSKVRQEATIAH